MSSASPRARARTQARSGVWVDVLRQRLLDRFRPIGPTPDELWALDTETTGLDVRRHHVIEVAAVPIRGRRIVLGDAFSILVKPEQWWSDGAAIHGIMPADLGDAVPGPDALDRLWSRVGRSPILCHHAGFDVGFLQKLHRSTGRPWPRPRIVDTMVLLERRNQRLARIGQAPVPYQLGRARAALGLPPANEHRALADAVATAELWLALTTPDRL